MVVINAQLLPHWTMRFYTLQRNIAQCNFCDKNFDLFVIFHLLIEHIAGKHNYQYDIYLNGVSHEEPDHGDFFTLLFFYITIDKTMKCILCTTHFYIWPAIIDSMGNHAIYEHYNEP